jgi:uncharacterized protein YxjI
MIYLMKQKLFSWGDDFTIKYDSNQDRFFVDGKLSASAISFPFRTWPETRLHSFARSC